MTSLVFLTQASPTKGKREWDQEATENLPRQNCSGSLCLPTGHLGIAASKSHMPFLREP